MNEYVDFIKRLYKEIEELENEKEELIAQRQAEIELATKDIRAKYDKLLSPCLDNIFANKTKINEAMAEYQAYASFPAELIGNALADLATTFEGEEYTYQETTWQTKETVHAIMDRMEVDVIKNVRVIIKAREAQENYEKMSGHFNEARRNGAVVILDATEDELDELGNEIVFKEFKRNHDESSDTINYGKFDYMQQYINFLIANRIKNNMSSISAAELEQLTKEFYQLNKETILAKYEQNRLLQEEAQKAELLQFEQEQAKKLQKFLK